MINLVLTGNQNKWSPNNGIMSRCSGRKSEQKELVLTKRLEYLDREIRDGKKMRVFFAFGETEQQGACDRKAEHKGVRDRGSEHKGGKMFKFL